MVMKEIGMHHAHAKEPDAVRLATEPSAADRRRWDEIQRLFERCRERPRDEWHALLRAECEGREGIAFEVMSLLVAAENLPPIEEPASMSKVV